MQDYLGDLGVLEAAERFYDRPFSDKRELSRYLSGNDAHSQFYPWVLWDADMGGHRLGRRLLGSCLRSGGVDAQIARALLDTRADVYQVTSCEDDVARLERVADGVMLTIEEPVLGNVSAPGELLIARILDMGDAWLLDAVHGCLPAKARRGMVRAARRARKAPVQRQLPMLLAAASRAMHRINHGQPILASPDGGDVVHCTLIFDVAAHRDVAERLDNAVGSGLLQRRGPRYVVADSVSGLAGVALHLSADRLPATTGCRERAEDLRARIIRWLPGLTYRFTVHADLDGLLLLADPWQEPDADAVRRLAEQWLQEYLTAFSDRPQRSLGGITPREAVRTARGRTKVRALLRSVQRFSDAVGTQCEGAVDSILSELAQG